MDSFSRSEADTFGARRVVAEVVSLLQGDVDGPTSVATLASASGHAEAAIRRALAEVMGAEPDVVRVRLRAERDGVLRGAVRLEPREPTVPTTVDADAAPSGLLPTPVIERLGPLTGWVVDLSRIGPVAITRGLWSLVRRGEPVAPYSMGVLTEAWGRGRGPQVFRCVRLLSAPADAMAGADAWSHPAAWYATFRYQGSVTGIDGACTWMAATWVPAAELRLAYGPLLALVEGVPDLRGRVTAALHLPVTALEA
jgi:hypothetical protein